MFLSNTLSVLAFSIAFNATPDVSMVEATIKIVFAVPPITFAIFL